MECRSIPTHICLVRPTLDRDSSEILTQACWHGLYKPGQDFGTQTLPCPSGVYMETLRVTLIHSHACPTVEL